MWVARDPLKDNDAPDQNFTRGAQLTNEDIRVDPQKQQKGK